MMLYLWVIAGLVVAGLLAYQIRTTKRNVAQQVEIALKLLKSNDWLAAQTLKNNRETAATLQSIHTLVNSNLSSARRDLLLSLRELLAIKEAKGLPVSQEARDRIAELAGDVKHADAQTQIAEEQS